MAEAVFQHMVDAAGLSDRVAIASAGTGDWHVGEPPHRGTLDALHRHTIPVIPGKRAQVITPTLLTQADYIIALDSSHVAELQSYGMGVDGKVSRLLDYAPDAPIREMLDPYYTGRFEEVYQLTEAGARGLLEHIRLEMSNDE